MGHVRRSSTFCASACIGAATATSTASTISATPRHIHCPAIAPSSQSPAFRKLSIAEPVVVELREWSRIDAELKVEHGRLTNRLVFERLLGKGDFYAYLATLDDFIGSRGGNPLVVGGKVIGAIGVSGGTGSQDDVI